MSMKRTSVKYISAAAIMAALATVDGWTARQSGQGAVFIGDAQARVGRPLTPASVAGVARRTHTSDDTAFGNLRGRPAYRMREDERQRYGLMAVRSNLLPALWRPLRRRLRGLNPAITEIHISN